MSQLTNWTMWRFLGHLFKTIWTHSCPTIWMPLLNDNSTIGKVTNQHNFNTSCPQRIPLPWIIHSKHKKADKRHLLYTSWFNSDSTWSPPFNWSPVSSQRIIYNMKTPEMSAMLLSLHNPNLGASCCEVILEFGGLALQVFLRILAEIHHQTSWREQSLKSGCWIGGGSPSCAINYNIWISGRMIYIYNIYIYILKRWLLNTFGCKWNNDLMRPSANILKKDCYTIATWKCNPNKSSVLGLLTIQTQDSYPNRNKGSLMFQAIAGIISSLLRMSQMNINYTDGNRSPLPFCFALRPRSPLIHPHHGLSCTSGSPEQCQILQDCFNSRGFLNKLRMFPFISCRVFRGDFPWIVLLLGWISGSQPSSNDLVTTFPISWFWTLANLAMNFFSSWDFFARKHCG